MKRILVIFLSLLGIGWSVYQLISILGEEPTQQSAPENEQSLTVWVTSPGMVPVIREFAQQFNVRVSIKTFREDEMMMDELILAAQTSRLPDLVEVNTLWTLNEVNDIVTPQTVEPFEEDTLHSAITQAFTQNESFYAIPLGLEMPVQFINERLTTGNQLPKWEIHMDRELPFYTRTGSSMSQEEFSKEYKEEWQQLIEEQEMPALDHQMAITRFANSEVGKLVASSDQTYIIQQVVGNSFPFRVEPLRQEDWKISIAGHGLARLTSHSQANELLNYIQQTENLRILLSETGWLPVKTQLLEDPTFLQQLPLPHIIRPLASNHRYYSSLSFMEYSRQDWIDRYNVLHEWERDYSQ